MKCLVFPKLIMALFVTGLAGTAIGQQKCEIGFHAGVAHVSMRGNRIIEEYQEGDLRFTGGIRFRYNLKNGFYLATQANYESKGSGIKERELFDNMGSPLGRGSGTNRINYVTFPILVGKEFGEKIKFNAQAGVFMGAMTSQKTILHMESGETTSVSDKNFYKGFDYGIAMGVGIGMPVSKKIIADFQLQDQLGLKNISAYPVIDDGSVKTHALKAVLGLRYSL